MRIAPVAALVETREEPAESLRRRVTIGGLAAGGGVAALVAGLTAPAIVLVGLGAVAVFIAAGMLAPMVARPLSGMLGRPLAALLGRREGWDARTRCAAHGGPPRPPPH